MRIPQFFGGALLALLVLGGCSSPTTTISTKGLTGTGPTYSVTYNSNGGYYQVPVDPNAYSSGAAVTTLGPGLIQHDYANFAGWMTQPDGSGTSYAAGAQLTMGSANVILYAIWVPTYMTFTANQNSITITSVNSLPQNTTSLSIPAGVTDIAPSASWLPTLTNLTLPLGLKTIGDWAFYANTTALKSVTIPPTVTYLGAMSFGNSTALASVNIPASVTSIGGPPFGGCTILTSITVDPANPNYSASGGILYNKTGTTLLELPNGLISGPYSVPAGVTTIGDFALRNCPNLTALTIPSTVLTIGLSPGMNSANLATITVAGGNPNYKAVNNCLYDYAGTTLIEAAPAFSGALTVPPGVTTIGTCAFIGTTTSLTAVTLPSGLTTIASEGMEELPVTSLTLPATLKTIGNWGFEWCSMTSLEIPAGVTSMGSGVFEWTSLTSLTMDSPTPPTLPLQNDMFRGFASSFTIHVPSAAAVTAYQTAPGWSDYASNIVTP